MHNEIQGEAQREEPRFEARAKMRVEVVTSHKNLIRNNPIEHIIGRKDRGVMKRKKYKKKYV